VDLGPRVVALELGHEPGEVVDLSRERALAPEVEAHRRVGQREELERDWVGNPGNPCPDRLRKREVPAGGRLGRGQLLDVDVELDLELVHAVERLCVDRRRVDVVGPQGKRSRALWHVELRHEVRGEQCETLGKCRHERVDLGLRGVREVVVVTATALGGGLHPQGGRVTAPQHECYSNSSVSSVSCSLISASHAAVSIVR
jgi:hypothetical protein